ncbi:energy-coupled thiamine transporter ThiT [Ruminococcus sp.]|uniref:energy-coupled thiamine transporter ThiT n=1 Tax=Ruminococcus sp. TaxID=41978 RepID=UPI0025DBB03C|nr:energy-coupled thiamine transporter ThiT [Ruminococcus sp.]MBQ8967499.1 energy-coupled thiamine transporter ThiT [Ruminococcus sp.]
MKNSKILWLVEGAVMVALASVLSLIKVYKLPWGGSITLLSMLPICIYSIKHGIGKGLAVSFVYALVQMFLDLGEVLSWGLTASTLIACLLLDYLVAYTVIGFAGIFRRKGMAGWIAGTVIALLLRLASHFASGVWIWESAGKLWDGFDTSNTYLYSLVYNGSYMVPEIIFSVIGAVILFSLPQTKRLIAPAKD